jgi:tRNA threonylcarbamoyladenosine biosynthesis protein TsaE
LWLVEWPERAGSALPQADLRIELGNEGQGRMARLLAGSDEGGAWLARLADHPEFAALSS